MNDPWFLDHAPDIFGTVMSGSLAVYSIVLLVSPLPRTIMRWTISYVGLATALVGLWHSTLGRLSPWPIFTMMVWIVLLTVGSIRYRARLIGAGHSRRRYDD